MESSVQLYEGEKGQAESMDRRLIGLRATDGLAR